MKKMSKKILSVFLTLLMVCSVVPLGAIPASAGTNNENPICLTSLDLIEWDRYTGNMGDSRLNVLGDKYEAGYGNKGIDGTIYENGFEAWIARWTFRDEISWVKYTYNLGGKYSSLTGKTSLIKSYNTTNFDTTVYFYNGETLLNSYRLTNADYNKAINVNVEGVQELTILVKDNKAVSGGTSLALYDLFLDMSDNAEIFDNIVEFNGHYYKCYYESRTWTQAKEYCEQIGGHLATITSENEEFVIEQLINSGKKRAYWLGGFLINGKWNWVTNEPFDEYTNWAEGEPNDYCGRGENSLLIEKDKWNDQLPTADPTGVLLEEMGFICEWDSYHDFNTNENEHIDKQEIYLQQHLNFVNSTAYNTVSNDFRYATTLWNNYHGSNSQAVAEFVYDIQEGFFETISFSEISSLENPYDAIILDLLSSKNIKASLSDVVDSSAISVIDGAIGDLITVFQADSDWADDINIADNFKDLLNLEAKDYSSNKLYQSLDKLFDGKSTEQINSMFSKYDCYSNVLENVSDAAKGVDYFLELLKYTASIEAYYNASKEFKVILKEVADVMPSVNADYGQKFNETYNDYNSCIDYNSVMQNVLNHATEEGFWLLTDIMSDVLQDSALTFCKTSLKMSESAAGALVASLWAAETGFNLANMITDNDTLVNCRRLLRANYMLDEAIHHVMSTHASNLKTNANLDEALLFDESFNLFKNLQLSSLQLHQKYMQANGSSFINFLLGRQEYFNREVQAKAVIIDTWKNIKCHDDKSIDSITYSKSNTVVVACPTNVYVYRKSDGELVASVVNNKVYNSDYALTAVTESNEKAICLPNLDDYEIKIEATDAGSMSVDYTVNSLERPHYERAVLFDNIELTAESSFEFKENKTDSSISLINQNQDIILPNLDTADLTFKAATITLQDDLAVNYTVDRSLFEDNKYANPYVVFESNNVKQVVDSYTLDEQKFVFSFCDIAPNQMNDTLYATLYATYNGIEYASVTKEYSVATYCYDLLNKYTATEYPQYAELRTLLVDLLNYGTASQIYTNYNTENLANAELTEEQLAFGTSQAPELTTVTNPAYETIENPKANWKSAGLVLKDSVVMRFAFTAEDISNMSIKIKSGENEWTIQSPDFVLSGDRYYSDFNGLNAGQMSEDVYVTIYEGDVAVSNTLLYSIESYAYSKQNDADVNLSNLVIAMMKYGNSAYAYVH